jgi:VWFA-related protein
MRHHLVSARLAVPLLLYLAVEAGLAAQGRPELPRFRAGANLVRVDAYVSKDDAALIDLTADDFTVYEDGQPQRVEAFELIRARAAVPEPERPDVNNTRDMRQQVADAARVFTLFFDPLYVSVSGSYRLQQPLVETLDQVIGPDDMVGAMTPDMPPSAISYSARSESIEYFVTRYWMWGTRDVRWPVMGDPAHGTSAAEAARESAIADCYPPPNPENAGIARAMIARLREQRTLQALASLVVHLEGMRQERKFVMIFTEGWPLYRPDASLSRVLEGRGPRPDPIQVDPGTGRIAAPTGRDAVSGAALTMNACERLRLELAQVDHERDFMALLQRANRANVSFYPVDARGLLVFDRPTAFDTLPSDDQALLRRRHGFLEDMALQTDGYAVLDTDRVADGLQKIFRDVGSYYLLGYYSTNQRLDGRYRRIRVDVKRPGATVRARPGYLAPTEEEARAASTAAERAASAGPPPAVTRALDSLAPARGHLPVRVQAIGSRDRIRAVVELDAATVKQPEWKSGGSVRVVAQPEASPGTAAGAATIATADFAPGQRTVAVTITDLPRGAGPYAVRAEAVAAGGRLPIQATASAMVPAGDSMVGSGALASRRGPATGLAWLPTADPRFRRTERIRIEVPLAGDGFSGTGRVLTREGQATALAVSFSTRADSAGSGFLGVADVVLAPLAGGEYVLELVVTHGKASEMVAYGFRIVP